MKRVLSILLVSAAVPAAAEIAFQWPVACEQGKDCYIQNYVDRDPGPEWQDVSCGKLSYDGHTGTDIAAPTHARSGLTVIAAAPGTVQGVRDGMKDILYSGQDLGGKDCGNGVVVDHGGGWVTQYCHLAQGSVSVASGDTVSAGDPLGKIGLSGRTEFPHVHFSVRKNGEVVDPFAPDDLTSCGDIPETTLWGSAVSYIPGDLLDAGFAIGVPEYIDVKQGTAQRPLTRSEPVVFFGFGFGAKPGDVLRFTLSGPDGVILKKDTAFDRARAQFFRATGKKAPKGGWAPGNYSGVVEFIRNGRILNVMSNTASIK